MFAKGARVGKRFVSADYQALVEVPVEKIVARAAAFDQAYILAISNKHKTWARRWLRKNAHVDFQ